MKKLILVFGLLVACSLAHANGDPANPCNDEEAMQSQYGMNACETYTSEKTKKELASIYASILKETGKAQVRQLRAAQKAWVAYRNAQCIYENAPSFGGSIYGLEVSACEQKLNEQRIAQLKAYSFGK